VLAHIDMQLALAVADQHHFLADQILELAFRHPAGLRLPCADQAARIGNHIVEIGCAEIDHAGFDQREEKCEKGDGEEAELNGNAPALRAPEAAHMTARSVKPIERKCRHPCPRAEKPPWRSL